MRTDADGRKIASRISMLAGIPDAAAVKKLAPEKMLTPLIACLDPRKRFPIINGGNVEAAISSLGLRTALLTDQFDALIAFIGPMRCTDALELDTLLDLKGADILSLFPKPVMSSGQNGKRNVAIKAQELDLKDEADVETISHAGSARMRRIHNRMTNAMQAIVSVRHRITEGTSPIARYDALIKNYANNGRDLLVEAKSSNDIAAIRLAIGQLIDYRRFIAKRYTTDLAVLVPSKPDQYAIELLAEAGVHYLWFSDQKMRSLKSSCGLQ